MTITAVSTTSIPLELRKLPQWVCWRYSNGTKIPINPRNLHRAKSTDNATWASYRDAHNVADRAGIGMGFVFTPSDPFCGIDLDGCIQGGIIDPRAEAFVNSLATYSEVSPGGQGVKMIVKGKKPNADGCAISGPNAESFGCKRIEIYEHSRFFTITSNHLGIIAIAERQKELTQLCNLFWPPRKRFQGAVPNNLPINDRERRCLAFVRKCCPAAVSGQGGHNATLRVACEAFRFGLDDQAALRVLEAFNEMKCLPKWSPKDLMHKIACARKKVSAANELGVRLVKKAS